MGILGLLIVGIAAGFLATRLMRVELGVVPTILIGIAGTLIGAVVIRMVLMITGLVGGLIGAVLGAMLLVWLWKMIGERR
ncbi:MULTISPECIES: GlsB/YeaQ/YmgE family stress response membrane protein [unclassified Roseovarius]|jgi:uncharacterized membrane protein YeaQ/YmgE (transglycosylase-associated protein family)|uniref:GlsB/YeaQ/YmgE family stress response membrane protein n=1 Tax=unclassified Roseovarius TaxID=2614913 RepID=UPI00006861F2|nr:MULTISPECIES: hypothetical protein [unclassified Roseovarius]EAQ25212.1 hypothetical protein ROS217_03940 [Roseovarius sp. 217]KJS41294.1 MAG: hypothetical protein VR71_19610 [Roseovarius sp. BRH_c41]KJS44506.1 MAG: hypothetical protein VR71_06325 [Roseovarius sp. BRH_c41]